MLLDWASLVGSTDKRKVSLSGHHSATKKNVQLTTTVPQRRLTSSKSSKKIGLMTQDRESQLDMFEQSFKKKVDSAPKPALRRIHTINDLANCDFSPPAPFRVIRISPTEVMVLKEGFGL